VQALFPFWAGRGARIIGWEYHGHDGHDLVGGRMAGTHRRRLAGSINADDDHSIPLHGRALIDTWSLTRVILEFLG
jgi:hypothetical protein